MVFSLIDKAADDLGDALKFPGDQVKLVFCLLISYPIGFIFKRIRNVTARHTFSVLLGLFFQYLIYRNDIIHPLILWLFTYYWVKFMGRNHAVLIFVVAIGYLAILHFRIMIEDWGGYRIDVTGSMMLSVCKCTSFAWNYKDGGVDINKLSVEQRKKRIVKLPSVFHYLSYVSFYGSGLVGPGCDYRDFEQFINQEGDYKDIPKTFLFSFGYLMTGLVSMALVTLFVPTFNAAGTIAPWYDELNWLNKYLYLTVAMFLHRCRYYTAWMLATANVTSVGLNYDPNGKTKFEKYGRIVAVKPIDGEIADNNKDKLEAWNTACQIWLKNYVYLRVCSEAEAKVKPAKATFASNVTFMVSAIWHGFYPGYYLAFFLMFMVQTVSKSLYRIRHKLRWIREPVGFIIRWLLAGFYVNVFGNIFTLLELGKDMTFLKAWYFIPYIILAVIYVLLTFTPLGKGPSKKPKQTNETPEEKANTNNGQTDEAKKEK